MAQASVWFVVDYAVDVTRSAEFERLAKTMSDETVKEAGTLAYKWHISPDRTAARLVESYVDGAAVLAHITGPVIRDFLPLISEVSKVTLFEVYGDPGEEASKLLVGFGAGIYAPLQGFSR